MSSTAKTISQNTCTKIYRKHVELFFILYAVLEKLEFVGNLAREKTGLGTSEQTQTGKKERNT